MYEVFEKLLKERGITAYRVSQDTNISTATLTSWKKGKYTPKREKLKAIADYFGVTMEYLMTGEAAPDQKAPYPQLSYKALEVAEAWMRAPEGIQESVCKLLDIETKSESLKRGTA